jgi:uroporphyrinogen decarboxylase
MQDIPQASRAFIESPDLANYPDSPDPSLISVKNDCILQAALGKTVDRIPVWVHRQAGRYLPEFNALRAKFDFFTVCKTPQLACEVTLQPLRRIPYDAAIIFSDILVVPQALGLTVLMVKGEGPHFPEPLNSPDDFVRLDWNCDVSSSLKYVYEAISLTRKRIGGVVPLLGFSGAPWTLMAYMIEGGGSKTLAKAKKWLYLYPEASAKLLDLLAKVVGEYLVHQINAGAQMVEVFDTWAEFLSPETYRTFMIPGLRQIVEFVREKTGNLNLPNRIPITLFAKGANDAQLLSELSELGYDVLAIDWTIDPSEARRIVQDRVTLQGNLDPCALYGSLESISLSTEKMLNSFGNPHSRLIVNLGHGVYPDHHPKSLDQFVSTVHSK